MTNRVDHKTAHARSFDRRTAFAILAGGALSLTALPAAAQSTPSARQMMRQLGAAPDQIIAPDARVSPRDIVRRRDLRHIAPSVDIQSINFAFGSARIGSGELWKVERMASVMLALAGRRGREFFLVEGHTDAVGSRAANQRLSEARAASIGRILSAHGVPRDVFATVGYGEDELLVPTSREEWRNRRVTLRRVTDVVVY